MMLPEVMIIGLLHLSIADRQLFLILKFYLWTLTLARN